MPAKNLVPLLHLHTSTAGTDEEIYTLCFDSSSCRLVVNHYHSGGQYNPTSYDVRDDPAEDYLRTMPVEAEKVRAFFRKVAQNGGDN